MTEEIVKLALSKVMYPGFTKDIVLLVLLTI